MRERGREKRKGGRGDKVYGRILYFKNLVSSLESAIPSCCSIWFDHGDKDARVRGNMDIIYATSNCESQT